MSASRAPCVRSLPCFSALLIGVASCSAPLSTHERVIDITADDYAFRAPDTVAAGPAVLRFANHGRVPHEMIIMRLRRGASVKDLVAAAQRGERFRPNLDGGSAVLFAQPGTVGDGRLAVDLEPGRDYVLWCEFQDSDHAPKHSSLGMFKQIHVADSAGGRAAQLPARRLTVDAGDYAFRVADTVPAGEVDLQMTNSGKQRHEVAIGRLKAGMTPEIFFAQYLQDQDVDSLYDDDGAILVTYGGDHNDFTIRVDFLAGRSYVLVCELRDSAEAPRHAKMGMFKGIVVR